MSVIGSKCGIYDLSLYPKDRVTIAKGLCNLSQNEMNKYPRKSFFAWVFA